MRETLAGSRLKWQQHVRTLLPEIFGRKGRSRSPINRANIVEVRTREECLALFQQRFAVIFKHSDACSVSRYITKLFVSSAQKDRISKSISSRYCTPVPPRALWKSKLACPTGRQVLAIRDGKIFAHASHEAITANFLKKLHQDWNISGPKS